MKILYDHQMSGRQFYGGVSRYFFEISTRIAELPGNDVEIFAPIYVNAYLRKVRNVRLRGLQIPAFQWSGYPIKLLNTSLARLVLPSRRDVGIFHETYYSMTDCRPRSARRIITVFDMIHEKFPQYFSRWDRTRRIKAHAVQRADHIICISENTRRDLIDIQGIAPEKISVVALGHSLLPFQPSTSVAALPQQPYILYVGGRVGYKNFAGLLRAYAESTSLREEFSLVCVGGGRFTAQELSLLKHLGLDQDKTLQVAANDSMLAALYSAAALFVFPSLYEGFGIPPLEAMSFGCPVACSNTSSLPEVVGNAAELFNPTDCAEIRTALERIAFSPQRKAQLVSLGHQRVTQFSWEKCAHETLRVYHKILMGEPA